MEARLGRIDYNGNLAARAIDSADVSVPDEDTLMSRGDLASGMRSARVRIALCVLAVTNLGTVVAVHVAGMFAPSAVSGWAVDRFGPWAVISAGGCLLVASGLAGVFMDPDSASGIAAILAALGPGWNCGVVSGSTMLSASVLPAKSRPRVEDIGEVAMGLAAGVVVSLGGFAALSSLTAEFMKVDPPHRSARGDGWDTAEDAGGPGHEDPGEGGGLCLPLYANRLLAAGLTSSQHSYRQRTSQLAEAWLPRSLVTRSAFEGRMSKSKISVGM